MQSQSVFLGAPHLPKALSQWVFKAVTAISRGRGLALIQLIIETAVG